MEDIRGDGPVGMICGLDGININVYSMEGAKPSLGGGERRGVDRAEREELKREYDGLKLVLGEYSLNNRFRNRTREASLCSSR